MAHRPVCARAYATDVQHLSGEQQQPLIQEVEWSAQDANFVSIIGNLGSDPDLRTLSGGHIKVSLNLAVKNFKKETSWCSTLHPQCHGFQCNPSMNAVIVPVALPWQPQSAAAGHENVAQPSSWQITTLICYIQSLVSLGCQVLG